MEALRAQARAGAPWRPRDGRADHPPPRQGLVEAVVRAWRDMLKSGAYITIREIAAAEKINGSYVGRILRLTLLAREIVEGILGGRQSAQMMLAG